MPRILSLQDFVSNTSRIVAAFCASNHVKGEELPALMATVGQKLAGLNETSPSAEDEPRAANKVRRPKPPQTLEKAHRSIPPGQVRSTIQPGSGRASGAALGAMSLTVSGLHRPMVEPKAVAAVSSAYQDAMAEFTRRSGYLPSRSGREMVAAKMIAAAQAGEWDAARLREAASLALRDDNVVPLSMTFANRLRRADVASSAERGKR